MYYRGAQAAIVVYDITNADSFDRAKNWVKELQRQGNPNIVISLAANKVDLESKRAVTAEVSYHACVVPLLSFFFELIEIIFRLHKLMQRKTASSSWRHPLRLLQT